jgi:hypothetical protein
MGATSNYMPDFQNYLAKPMMSPAVWETPCLVGGIGFVRGIVVWFYRRNWQRQRIKSQVLCDAGVSRI